jgi:hypothetical protein
MPHNATAASRQAFAERIPSVRHGFAGTFDLLADYAATL